MGIRRSIFRLTITVMLLAVLASGTKASAQELRVPLFSSNGAVSILGPHSAELGFTGITMAYALNEAETDAGSDEFEEDPWEPFNERMFWFNRNVFDRFLLKPVATAWDTILPDPVQRSIHNAIDNLSVVRRLVNNIFQLKMGGAGREVARFTINSTIGVVGLFDVAKDGFGIEQSNEDTGQTMGVYGVGPGPYLVLPFLPVLTVRDGFGFVADGAMNPLSYFVPWGVTAGIYGTDAINERSLNLDKFEQVEESVIDLYSAVRNGYLQRREAAIKE
ncbi:MAG TPA: VacJ family lipoprotein [Candidatus Binatia bacterium]|jgi:phospholipid-binding lipoprotein MlaA|nr:VacJ family lipoprotein [Candidatus Binatia bacterium]